MEGAVIPAMHPPSFLRKARKRTYLLARDGHMHHSGQPLGYMLWRRGISVISDHGQSEATSQNTHKHKTAYGTGAACTMAMVL